MLSRPTTAAAILALASAALAQGNSAPCFETSLGVNLNAGDETVAPNNALGFSFPCPGGTQVTAIDISSNGFVWLGSNADPRCCDGSGFQFTADPPSIAAMWENLDPSATTTGGVFFNTFPATGGAPARAVITWSAVPESGGPTITVQMQLLDSGEITIAHDPGNTVASHQMLMGVTQGNGATANPVAFSAISSLVNTGANPTAYQEFTNGTYDIAARSYDFVPNGLGGYLIFERLSCRAGMFTKYGTGCPALVPVSFYEEFPGGTFDLNGTRIVGVPNGNNGYVLAASASTMFQALTTNLNLTDDSISGPITLPFTFVHPAGQTNVICVSSNGFIWFQSGGSDRAFSDHTILLQDPPSLAALWMDLNPDPPINGGVFADPDPNGQVFYVTWSGVPEYNHPASANTFQIALFANGNFELRYPSAGTVAHTALVGYSTGNGAPDPGPIDWSAALPFNTGTGGAPLELDAAPGSRPRIGTTFTLQTARIPAGTPLGFMLLGFNRTATDLTPLGMAGCTGFVGLQASSHTALAFATPATVVPFPINVPNNNALVGVTVFAQSATLSTGFTPLGVIASNGGQLDLGR